MELISDEKLQKFTVGDRKAHNDKITLSEYDLEWPVLFAREAKRIKSILGDRALSIEHVGSTSVPGLCAKPIIDILLTVADSADEEAYVSDLEKVGYVLRIREADWNEHRMLKGPDTDINLHVFGNGNGEIKKMLGFRDWLRTNEEDQDLYAMEKRRLSQRTWRHIQHYADAKTDVVTGIMKRAGLLEG